MKNLTRYMVAMSLLLGAFSGYGMYDPSFLAGALPSNMRGIATGSLDTLGAVLLASGAYGKLQASKRQIGDKSGTSFGERHYGKMAMIGATLLATSQALRRPETVGRLLDNAQLLVADAYDKVGLVKDTVVETGKAAGSIAQDTGRGWLGALSDRWVQSTPGKWFSGRAEARAQEVRDAGLREWRESQIVQAAHDRLAAQAERAAGEYEQSIGARIADRFHSGAPIVEGLEAQKQLAAAESFGRALGDFGQQEAQRQAAESFGRALSDFGQQKAQRQAARGWWSLLGGRN